MKYIKKIDKNSILNLFQNHVSFGKVEFFKSFGIDFVFGVREGIYVYDVESQKELINCHCNGGVFNLGHRNKEIINHLKEALEELDIGNHHFISEQRALLARKLFELTPGNLEYTVFGVSGGEAIDVAIKIARAYTKKTKIISAIGAYHGHTGFALATGDKKYKKIFEPLAPGFIQIEFDNIDTLNKAIEDDTAAVIFETVLATNGILVPSQDYFLKVRELCNQKKVLFIIDEVQTGLGRTGKLWGIEHFHTVPDIMVIGKGLSGGIYPITATCFKKEFEGIFHNDPFIHISTFGGSELGCIVALKVLEISSSKKFLSNVNTLSEFFKIELNALKGKFPYIISSIRQLGMMMGIKMHNEKLGPLMSKACYENGLLCIFSNNDPSVLQFLPPLIINLEQAKEIIKRLDRSFEYAQEKYLKNL